MSAPKTAAEFLDYLDRNIGDRRGLKWEWNKIDDDVKAEIRATWGAKLDALLAAVRAEAYERAAKKCDAESRSRRARARQMDAGYEAGEYRCGGGTFHAQANILDDMAKTIRSLP